MVAVGQVGYCILERRFAVSHDTGHCPRLHPRSRSRHFRGFTLVELSIVIVILALILGTVIAPLAIRHQMKQNKQAEDYLLEVKEALIGFAIMNGRLPWPDTDMPPDGVENAAPPTPPSCTTCEGLLPWRTIGTLPADTWGRIYRYRVTHEFASPVQTGLPPASNRFDLFDRGDVRINTRVDHSSQGTRSKLKEDIVLTDDAAATVVSSGRNGAGGQHLDGAVVVDPLAHTDESINADGVDTDPPDPHFYARPIASPGSQACSDTVAGSPNCDFDDLVIWIPSSVLIKRMLDAGRLP